jgi:hypothetical protein
MKVEKTIDAHEKSVRKLFDALTIYSQKYPDDYITMFIGRKIDTDEGAIIQSSSFCKDNNEEHFFLSHIWNLAKLMEALSPEIVKKMYNDALGLYKQIHEL